MKHEISNVVVYQTTDYTKFSMVKGNRGLNQNKINKIISEINAGNNMLPYYPIQVQETSNKIDILDGQHRFFISRKLKQPVFYILVHENKTMADIAKVNSNVEKWNQKDFINCYITQGNQHYVQLQQFLEDYKINIGTSLRLLSFGHPGVEGSNPELQKQFENGLFKVQKMDEAVAIAQQCKKFAAFPYHTDRGFVIAIHRVEVDTLVDAYNKNPDKLEKNHSQKQYLFNLEQILNIGKHKRIVIT
jgi:hypothetical protein